MKKFFLFAISILGLMGPFGCGKLQMPTTPAIQTKTITAPVTSATPVFAGSWTNAGSTSLVNPQGIAIDENGNLYVTDLFLNAVFKFDSNGNLLAQWGSRSENLFDEPTGIATKNGRVYVADSSNYRVVVFDTNGRFIAELRPQDRDGNNLFVYPTGVSVDGQGNLYVADNSDAVYQFNDALQLTAQWNAADAAGLNLDYPMASTEDSFGNVYVANYGADSILKYSKTTGSVTKWGTTGTQNSQFQGPSDVKLDGTGNVYVADSLNGRIQIFSTTGSYLGQFGSSNDPNQELENPYSMAFDTNSNLYVVDNGTAKIVKYSTK